MSYRPVSPLVSPTHTAPVAQLAEATVSNTVKCRFESDPGHVDELEERELPGVVVAMVCAERAPTPCERTFGLSGWYSRSDMAIVVIRASELAM